MTVLPAVSGGMDGWVALAAINGGIDWWVVLAGLIVGVVVGLTGMGGGALMTPILVLVFGVTPLAAVSSDLVASAIMKPFGGVVHLWRGTVDRAVVGWLCLGSVPAAFAGVFVARALGHGEAVSGALRLALGAALLVAAGGLLLKTYLRPAGRTGAAGGPRSGRGPVRVAATVLLGALGGLVVGITSVGAGSLVVVGLLAIYPSLRANDLVGTDLVQAVPLVASAALAHVLFGDFRLGLTAAMVIGAVPGVLVGSLVSATAPAGPIRWALLLVLLTSGLKLVGAGTVGLVTAGAGLAVAAAAVPVGRRARRLAHRCGPRHAADRPVDRTVDRPLTPSPASGPVDRPFTRSPASGSPGRATGPR